MAVSVAAMPGTGPPGKDETRDESCTPAPDAASATDGPIYTRLNEDPHGERVEYAQVLRNEVSRGQRARRRRGQQDLPDQRQDLRRQAISPQDSGERQTT